MRPSAISKRFGVFTQAPNPVVYLFEPATKFRARSSRNFSWLLCWHQGIPLLRLLTYGREACPEAQGLHFNDAAVIVPRIVYDHPHLRRRYRLVKFELPH